MIRALVGLRILATRVGFALGTATGMPRGVLLATAHLDAPTGNLAAIGQALGRRGVTPLVLARGARPGPLARFAWLLFHVVAGFRLARARLVVVDDYFFPLYAVRPHAETTVVQVWHACGALKKFGWSVLDKTFGAREDFVRAVRIHSNYDLCLVSSKAAIPHYADAFRQPEEAFVSALGIPRTDVLAERASHAAIAAEVRRELSIPAGRRVLLYAPTFRGDRVGTAESGPLLDLRSLADALGPDFVVVLRLHPFVRARLRLPAGLGSSVVDASAYADVNRLMIASDILVTDYSSVVFEYALLRRPIVLFAPDLERYERERGFYIDYRSDMPGPVFTEPNDLVSYVADGSFDLARVARFAERWFDVADGQATERFVERVALPALARGRITAADVAGG